MPPRGAGQPYGGTTRPKTDTIAEPTWPLRLQLLLWVSIALLPIAIASLLQGVDRAQRDIVDVRERLVQSARAASTGEENMLASGEQILRALANLPEVRNAGPGCSQALGEALKGLSFIVSLSRIGPDGRVRCSALPRAIGNRVSSPAFWDRVKASRDFQVSEQIYGRLLKRQLISGMLPLRGRDGRFDGALSFALDVRWLDYIVRAKKLPADAVVAIFDRKGAVISSNDRVRAVHVFDDVPSGALGTEELQSAKDAKGATWTYATSALLGNSIFVGFAMPDASLYTPTYVHVGTDFLMPILMIALAWAAIWVATERQVTRWIDYLRRISLAYRSGHYSIRPSLENAPAEFRALGDALADMAAAVQDRDQKLRDAVEQKTLLVREIHHRVKNNLQIVVSLLNLQARELKDSAAQEALKQARMRINALALVHRILHDIEEQTLVNLKPLLEDLTTQTNEGLGGERRDIAVSTDIAPRHVSGDVAVPLALFTVEALTNIFKHAYPGGGGSIRVSLAPAADGKLELTIEDDGVGFEPERADNSMGSRLIKTFAQQLGGAATIASTAKGTAVSLLFPDPEAKAA